SGYLAECSRVAGCYFSSSRQVCIQLCQLLHTKSTGNICQAVVVSEEGHLVEPSAALLPVARIAVDSMIAEAAKCLGELGIVGRDHSAFSGGQVFYRVKTEHSHMGDAACTP